MINDSKSAHFIAWTELGTSFVVSNVGEFSRSILGSHFKHNNVSPLLKYITFHNITISNISRVLFDSDPRHAVFEFCPSTKHVRLPQDQSGQFPLSPQAHVIDLRYPSLSLRICTRSRPLAHNEPQQMHRPGNSRTTSSCVVVRIYWTRSKGRRLNLIQHSSIAWNCLVR